jgi:hypothetical protein
MSLNVSPEKQLEMNAWGSRLGFGHGAVNLIPDCKAENPEGQELGTEQKGRPSQGETRPNFRDQHNHQFLLLLVEYRASMKSFQALRNPAISLTSFHDLPVFIISSAIVLRHVLFGLPILLYP